MSRPTDPIRDPELTREEAEALARPEWRNDECQEWGEAETRGTDKLRAALEDSPTQPRYTLEEIKGLLLGEEGVCAGASVFLPDAIAPSDGELNEFRKEFEAAIDAAFNPSTSTGEEGQAMSEPVERVVVLSDDDLQRLLRGGRADDAMKANLRKALEQPQGERTDLFRVLSDFPAGEIATATYRSRGDAEDHLRLNQGIHPDRSHQLQQQTIFTGPWTDIDQQEGEQ